MRLTKWALLGLAALLTTPMFGSTYFGGLEDWNGLDYDYNDVVFSLKASNLELHSSAKWFTEPTLGTSGTPFWNHASLDGPQDNVGYCIYGGGTCNGGAALDAGAKYLASNKTSTGSANNVTFTASGEVVLNIAMQITDAKNVFGWYLLSNPTTVNWLDPNSTDGLYSFDPGGAFGLVGKNDTYTYYSQSNYGSADSVSHFAFFNQPAAAGAPEPGMFGLMSLGLLASALFLRRQRSVTE